MIKAFAAAAVMAMLGASAWAQPAPTQKIHGVVTGFVGEELDVKRDDGGAVTIIVPGNARVSAVANKTLADIKPNDFVGSAAEAGTDGKLHALEVHIFPDSMRGTGEGHRPWDAPKQTMTNGAVAGIATAANGRELKIKYNGGEQTIDVGPDVRVVALVPGDRSLLKPGAAVTIRAARAADGSLTAQTIQAEKDGAKPLP